MSERRRARQVRLGLVAAGALLLLAACGLLPRREEAGPPRPRAALARQPGELPAPTLPFHFGPTPVFESDDFVVTFAEDGDTAERLAARHLGDLAKAWMIEDFNRTTRFAAGQEVVIPKRPWNPAGVDPDGYQLVPVLVYHNITPQGRGKLVIAAKSFDQQMRLLKSRGYRVVSLADFHDFTSLRRQIPRNAVVLTFDDGYKSFLRYAYPVLKELGFTATLFIYTDYVGVGREALSWPELRALAADGFDIQPHTKSHGDLRRRPGEPDEAYTRRMQAELGQPLALLQRQLGRPGRMLAYPFGYSDDAVVQSVKEHGYVAAFDVLPLANPSFVNSLRVHRRQIYADMTLEEFARALNTFSEEPIK